MANTYHYLVDQNRKGFFLKIPHALRDRNQSDYEFLLFRTIQMGIHTQYPKLLWHNEQVHYYHAHENVACPY